ncbi:MAG: hypothetical protein Kow00123_00480 [Anaerolineales bacterium]
MFQQVNWLTAGAGLVLLVISVLSAFRPNLVWGDPRPRRLPPERLYRLYRRRQIGTVVFFIAGAALLLLSAR